MRRDIFTAEQEDFRLLIGSVAQARAALDTAVEYVSSRQVFGKPLSTFQNTKFELAAVAAEVEAAQALVDRALLALVAGELSGADAAIAKLFCTEMQARAVDRCLQLFGGYGYITEFPIARLSRAPNPDRKWMSGMIADVSVHPGVQNHPLSLACFRPRG